MKINKIEKVRAIILRKGKIAIISYKDTNTFMLPGGKIENEEDDKKALFREIQEETGMSLEQKEPIFLCKQKFETTISDENKKSTITRFYFIETDQDFNEEKKELTDKEKKSKVKTYWINPSILKYRLEIALKNHSYTSENKYFDRYANEVLIVLKSFENYHKKKNKNIDFVLGG